MDNRLIYHVTDQATLDQIENDSYSCASLAEEGFIHCCTEEQLAGVLARYYQGVSDLKLLTIVVNSLNAKLVYENTVGGEELYPHVYGPINMAAVKTIKELQ